MVYKRLTDKRLAIPKGAFRQAKSKEEYLELSKVAYKTDNAEIYNRLSDIEDKIEQGTLIEQKTCKNISEMHPVDGFTCSECGISIEDYCEKEVDEENGDITYREYMLRYCPNCGAKVVNE